MLRYPYTEDPLAYASDTICSLFPSFKPLTPHEAQSRIDRLLWAKGYKYTIEAETPPDNILNTPYNKIFVQKSAYNKVKRTPPVTASEKEILPAEMSTLYVSLDDNKFMSVSWLETTGLTKSFSVNLNDNISLSQIDKLLPSEGQSSSNPALLRDLCLTCGLSDNGNDNVLICSVRIPHELGKAKSGDKPNYGSFLITKKDLNLDKIENNFILDDTSQKQILNKALKLKYANEGFTNIKNDEVIWPDDHEKESRNHLTRLLIAALILEVPYIYLQAKSSFIGWNNLLAMATTSTLIAYFGAFDDFFNNIFGILTVNDAQDMVGGESEKKWTFTRIMNDVSFFIGGAGNSLGILALLLEPLYKDYPIAFYVLSAITVPLIAITGKTYYWAFNNTRYNKTLTAEAKSSDDYFANTAIAIAATLVLVFRSVGFGGIAVLVLRDGLHLNNPWLLFAAGISATFATAVSIWSTRIQTIRDFWLNDEFKYLLPQDIDLAWKKFNFKTILNQDFVLTTLESVCMAVGFILFSEFKTTLGIAVTSAIGLLLIDLMIKALLRRENKMQALETLKFNGNTIEDIKERYSAYVKKDGVEAKNPMYGQLKTPSTKTAVSSNTYRAIEMTNVVAQEVCSPFIQDAPDLEKGAGHSITPIETADLVVKSSQELANIEPASDPTKNEKEKATPVAVKVAAADVVISEFMDIYYLHRHHENCCGPFLSIPFITALIVAISVTSRGIGFLGYVDTVNGILHPIKTFALNHFMQVMGLALIFAPPNVRNMFNMFYGNLSGNVAKKFVDRDIILVNERKNGPTSCLRWAFYSSPFGPSAKQLTVAEFNYAIDEKIEEIRAEMRDPIRKIGK